MRVEANHHHPFDTALQEGDFVSVHFDFDVSNGFLGFVISAGARRLRMKAHQTCGRGVRAERVPGLGPSHPDDLGRVHPALAREAGAVQLQGEHRMTIKAIFIYTDGVGRPILRKVRREGTRGTGSKDFRIQAARIVGGRLSWTSGKGCVQRHQPDWADRVIYNLPVVLSALSPNEPVWLAEGERDCDTLMAVARVAATTTHQGIERMTPEQAEWFIRGDSTINILMDRDEAGAYGGWARFLALTEAGVDASRLRLWKPVRGFKDVSEAALSVGLRDALVRASRRRTRDAAIRYGTARASLYRTSSEPDAPPPYTRGA